MSKSKKQDTDSEWESEIEENNTNNTNSNKQKKIYDDLDYSIETLTLEQLNKLPIEELEIKKDPPVKDIKMIEFSNPLSEDIKDEIQKMTPLEMFLFIIDEWSAECAKLTKEYAETVFQDKETKISREEIELYIFIFIFMSVYQLPEMNMLWDEGRAFGNVVPKFITKQGYKKLNKYLCIFPNNDWTYKENQKVNPLKKTDKIDSTIEYFNKKWQSLYPYTKYITIDEAMTAYKGGISFKQYIKDKHKRLGIKFFAKASADKGYMYEIIPYSGKGFQYNENIGMGASIVKKLVKGHENKGFHFTLDSYYANMYSFKYLYDHGINFTATFVRDRRALPEKVRKTVVKTGQAILYQLKNTTIKMYIFHSVKQIQIASSCFGVEKVKYINKQRHLKYKPEMIAYYNQTKAGVDLVDCATQIYKSQRKTYKWWKAVFFYLIDVTLNNCKIAYMQSLKYRKEEPVQGAGGLFYRRVLINQFIEYFHPSLEDEKKMIKVIPNIDLYEEMNINGIFGQELENPEFGIHYMREFRGQEMCAYCKIKRSMANNSNEYNNYIYTNPANPTNTNNPNDSPNLSNNLNNTNPSNSFSSSQSISFSLSSSPQLNLSSFLCPKCSCVLCPECFLQWHQEKVYEKI